MKDLSLSGREGVVHQSAGATTAAQNPFSLFWDMNLLTQIMNDFKVKKENK